jgi:alpha-beta hydrolase superfamily lysophospholipase
LRVAAPVIARLAPRLHVPEPITGDMLSTDPAVGEAYDNDPLVVRWTTPALGVAFLRQMAWANANLRLLDVPTLVLHGADDRIVPARTTRDLADSPLVTRFAYPGLRHELFNEPSHATILGDLVTWLEPRLER